MRIEYNEMGRLEEAVTFYRQAADRYVTRKRLIGEGTARYNLAHILIRLRRYDDARRELERAIVCKKHYGHAAEPWKTWATLHDLERIVGNPQAAADARQQAMQCYMAYRRDGGEGQKTSTELCTLVAQAIQQGKTTEVVQVLVHFAERQDAPAWIKIVIAKLQTILNGNRDPALADDPDLYYRDAVELQFLLDRLT